METTPIKPEDLRVGNLVNYEGNPHPILAIDSTKEYMELKCNVLIPSYWNGTHITDKGVWLKDIQPIPLTEEWLLKFGLKNEGYDFLFYDKDGLSLCGDNETGFVFNYYTEQGHGRGQLEVATVHQLQNLYHALTGQELTFKDA